MNKFKVRKKYVAKNQMWECLAIRGEYVWLVSIYSDRLLNTAAYVWRQDGTAVSLDETYNVDFAVTELVEEVFA